MQKEVVEWFRQLQDEICDGLNGEDKSVTFREDDWKRLEGGGGRTRIFTGGKIIEKGGVNFSAVYGEAPVYLQRQLEVKSGKSETFFGAGISIVIHPASPELPIIHMNTRYFELGQLSWFGGGMDLTPHYIEKENARFFHTALEEMCSRHDKKYYPDFRKQADDYFFLPHRNETRGIGGIFYDRLKEEKNKTLSERFDFIRSTGKIFLPVYLELINSNKNKKYGENELRWQRLRRGRYAEFNLIYDRGTRFGLESNGRTESILMSLPPVAQWDYDYNPPPGSREAETLGLLKKGINWIDR